MINKENFKTERVSDSTGDVDEREIVEVEDDDYWTHLVQCKSFVFGVVNKVIRLNSFLPIGQ